MVFSVCSRPDWNSSGFGKYRNPSRIFRISFGRCYASFQPILIILNVSESLKSPLSFFFGSVLVLLTREDVAERKCDPGIQTVICVIVRVGR